MAQWAAFVGLTAVLTISLLALARLSQGALDPSDERVRDPVVPYFESAESFERRSGEPSLNGRSAGQDHSVPGGTEPALADLSTGALLANVALTQGAFGLVLAAGAFYFEIPPSTMGIEGTPSSTGISAVAVGVAFGTGLWLANEVAGTLAEAAGVGFDESLRGLLAPDSAGGWVVLLGAVLPTIALVEEFVFRAAAVGAVSEGLQLSPWLLAVLSSIAFGVAHGSQGRAGMLVAGAMGFALAGGFVITGSLLVVVVAHYLVNALEMVIHEGLGIERPLG